MPNYVKFFMDILARKRMLREFETVALIQECSYMLHNEIPHKLKDSGSFTISCSIWTKYNDKAFYDLKVSINLIPLLVFKQLIVGEVKLTTMTLQLHNISQVCSEGKIEGVLVKVDKFIF